LSFHNLRKNTEYMPILYIRYTIHTYTIKKLEYHYKGLTDLPFVCELKYTFLFEYIHTSIHGPRGKYLRLPEYFEVSHEYRIPLVPRENRKKRRIPSLRHPQNISDTPLLLMIIIT